MRIDRIQVGAFGRLRDFDTGPTALDRLVVVLGPNEAGKSTLFSFLTTALYGFQPATRERNPHVPWGADEASGSIRVHLDAERCAEVERTLRSQPAGRLKMDGQTTDLRNQPVPWVGHVPRRVFRQVFAVTLGELAGLDGETWARIQDKVIGSMGAADLGSARAAAEALEREAGEIWRPNRRGNQRLRALQRDARTLRGRRTAAQERDAQVRRLVDERDGQRAELADVRERRHLDRAEVERAQSLLPVARQLARIVRLRDEGGARETLCGLPPDPPGRYADILELLRVTDERRQAAEHEMVGHEATIARAASVPRDLVDKREEILRLIARAAGCAPDRIRAVEFEGEVEAVEARMDAAAAHVLRASWRDLPAGALTTLPIELLRTRITPAPPAPAAERGSGAPKAATWSILAAGVALLMWGLMASQLIATAIGGGAIAAAVTWFLALRASARSRAAAGGRQSTHQDVRALLLGVPVSEEHLARPSESLATELERLRELARARSELARALAAAGERVVRVDAEARALARALDRDDKPDAEAIARDLDRLMRESERLQDAKAGAEHNLERLRRERDASARSVAILRAEVSTLEDAATTIGLADVEMGLEEAHARIRAHARADQLEEELDQVHPNLAELRSEIARLDEAGHTWSVDEEALARARARIEAHDERIEGLLTRGEALEGEATRLRDEETVDAVDSEITSLREEEARLMRARDRKWVLARVLREADRRFREEHQPDLVRRASSYLSHLTGGRYERLIIDETDGDHLFHLVGPTLPAPVPLAPPVSTGTLEQAYLSLRLAIVDHLDQGGEKLPLFVDEIFVNWDGNRRARGLEVLAGIASTRQVFVFTCHPEVASELGQRGGRVLELDRVE